jgi:predicted ATPase with chaperone activity
VNSLETARPTLDLQTVSVLRKIVKDLDLSARTYARILVVARRFASWARADKVETGHLLEAVQWCTLTGER